MTHLQEFDMDKHLSMLQKDNARQVKRHWIKQGYTQQLSFYGALKTQKEPEPYGVRIEVLSNTYINERIMHNLYGFFASIKPHWSLSIWIYDQFRESVKLVGKYE